MVLLEQPFTLLLTKESQSRSIKRRKSKILKERNLSEDKSKFSNKSTTKTLSRYLMFMRQTITSTSLCNMSQASVSPAILKTNLTANQQRKQPRKCLKKQSKAQFICTIRIFHIETSNLIIFCSTAISRQRLLILALRHALTTQRK